MLTKFKLVEITEHTVSPLRSSDGYVYDLEVEGDHSYNIEGIVVHNSGNACSTRIKAGVGYPQLSAVLETSDAIHGLGGHVISDGGITCPGDVAKAFAAGSDMVMMGSYLAGTTEGLSDCIPKYIYENNKPVAVEFYGMSSRTAQEAHGGSLSDYRASEGRVLHVPLKGSVSLLIQDLLGSLRSTCTYSGARTLKELPKRATFCQVHRQISTIYGVGKLME